LEVRPKAKGLDTRNELLKFYEENYSTNLMHLVIYTNGNKCLVYNIWVVLLLLLFLNGYNPIICAWIFAESLDKIQNLVE